MKLSVVVPVLNQHDLASTALDFTISYLGSPADVVVIDNASNEPFKYSKAVTETHEVDGVHVTSEISIVRMEKNIGVYPVFWEALKHTDADILAFFHSDVIIAEKNWDTRVLKAFEDNPKLGLLGFIGSDEIDASGGRGLGTTSNFQGATSMRAFPDGSKKVWTGSPAEAHGKRSDGYSKAAVVDGCVMVFRREVLENIKQRTEFPPHHFYDRLLSTETREAGYEMGVLGIGFDHISGQTVNQEDSYGVMAEEWATKHGLERFADASINPRYSNWDTVLYREAEKQWLSEYRDIKHLVPCKV